MTVADCPIESPVTVNTRTEPDVDVTETDPADTVGVAHVNAASKFVIDTVKPSDVLVGTPNTGANAAPNAVPSTVAEPDT